MERQKLVPNCANLLLQAFAQFTKSFWQQNAWEIWVVCKLFVFFQSVKERAVGVCVRALEGNYGMRQSAVAIKWSVHPWKYL